MSKQSNVSCIPEYPYWILNPESRYTSNTREMIIPIITHIWLDYFLYNYLQELRNARDSLDGHTFKNTWDSVTNIIDIILKSKVCPGILWISP